MDLQRIKFLCETRQIIFKYLAARVGMSEANLHRCIRLNKIQADILERIALELNVSIIEFFDEKVGVNSATASGAGSGATNSGNIRIINHATPAAKACEGMAHSEDDDPRVLRERIKGLEARLNDKDEIINLLKSRI